MHGDLSVITNASTGGVSRGRVGIVGHHDKRIKEDEVTERTRLCDLYIAMQAAVVTHSHITLDVAEGSDHAVMTDGGVLADAGAMSGRKITANFAPCIDNGVAPDERVISDDCGRVVIVRVRVVARQGFADYRVVADGRVIADFDIVVNRGIITDPYIAA